MLIVVGGIIAVGTVLLLIMMYFAFRDRREAEANVDKHVEALVALVPNRFLPKAE